MGGFRDDHEALRVRIDALESELREGEREAARRELALLREQIAEATARVQKDDLDLATLASRLEALDAKLAGDPVVPPAPSAQKSMLVAVGCAGLMMVMGMGAVFAFLATPAEQVVVVPVPPVPPTAPIPPPPVLDPLAEEERGETPTRAEIVLAMRAVKPALLACAERHPDIDRNRPLLTQMRFLSDGTVGSASLVAAYPDGPGKRCLEDALATARVEPFAREDFSVSYPIVLR